MTLLICAEAFVFTAMRTVTKADWPGYAGKPMAPIPCLAIWIVEPRRNTALAPTKWWPTSIIIPRLSNVGFRRWLKKAILTACLSNGAACYGASPTHPPCRIIRVGPHSRNGPGKSWMKPKARPSLTFRRWNTAKPSAASTG